MIYFYVSFRFCGLVAVEGSDNWLNWARHPCVNRGRSYRLGVELVVSDMKDLKTILFICVFSSLTSLVHVVEVSNIEAFGDVLRLNLFSLHNREKGMKSRS